MRMNNTPKSRRNIKSIHTFAVLNRAENQSRLIGHHLEQSPTTTSWISPTKRTRHRSAGLSSHRHGHPRRSQHHGGPLLAAATYAESLSLLFHGHSNNANDAEGLYPGSVEWMCKHIPLREEDDLLLISPARLCYSSNRSCKEWEACGSFNGTF